MENRIKQAFPYKDTTLQGKRVKKPSPELIRYADDFVILHEDLNVVQRCQQIISEWLSDMGLELKPSKTRLAHTLYKYEQEEQHWLAGISLSTSRSLVPTLMAIPTRVALTQLLPHSELSPAPAQ